MKRKLNKFVFLFILPVCMILLSGFFSVAVAQTAYAVSDGYGAGIYVGKNSTFNFSSGSISGFNTTGLGGGVFVDTGGTFNMTGGSIYGNTASLAGNNVANSGTFTMTGGTIGLSSTKTDGVYNSGTMNIYGGTIYDNISSTNQINTKVAATISGTITLGYAATVVVEDYVSTTPNYNIVVGSDREVGPIVILKGGQTIPSVSSINISGYDTTTKKIDQKYENSSWIFYLKEKNNVTIDPDNGEETQIKYGNVNETLILPTFTKTDYMFKGYQGESAYIGANDEVERIWYSIDAKYKFEDLLTVNCWVYLDNWTEFTRAISCTESGGWNFEKETINNEDVVRFAIYEKGYGYNSTNGVALSSISAGWHMLTGTFDGSKARFYFDGVLKATSNTFSSGKIGYNDTNSIIVGAEAIGTANAIDTSIGVLPGKIKKVSILNCAFSSNRISAMYENGQNGSQLSYGFSNRESTTLTAQWESIEYDLKYQGNGGTVSTSVGSVKYGKNYQFPTGPKRTGYTFKGWTKNYFDYSQVFSKSSTCTQSGSQFTFKPTSTSQTTYGLYVDYYNGSTYVGNFIIRRTTGKFVFTFTKTASFNELYIKYNGDVEDSSFRYDVSTLENNETYVMSGTITTMALNNIVVKDIMIEQNTRSMVSNYTNSFVTASTICTETGGHTLFAMWEIAKYTITFDKDGGYGGTSSITVSYGQTLPNITIPIRAGYAFVGYYKGTTQYYSSTGEPTRSNDLTSSVFLTAHWSAKTFARINADGIESSTGQYVLYATYPQTSVIIPSGTILASDPSRDNVYNDAVGNTYTLYNGTYYRHDLIRWRIISETSGTLTLIAENILNVSVFNNSSSGVYDNFYYNASLNAESLIYDKLLGFFDGYLSTNARLLLEGSTYTYQCYYKVGMTESNVKSSHSASVWLPSYSDLSTSLSWAKTPTDYAKALGAPSQWWLRNGYDSQLSGLALTVNASGSLNYSSKVTDYNGVVPMITINKNVGNCGHALTVSQSCVPDDDTYHKYVNEYKCTICNIVEKTEDTDEYESHSLTTSTKYVAEGTTGHHQETTSSCSVCGYSKETVTDTVSHTNRRTTSYISSAAGHAIVTTTKCTVCSWNRSITGPVVDHTFKSGKCSVCGYADFSSLFIPENKSKIAREEDIIFEKDKQKNLFFVLKVDG